MTTPALSILDLVPVRTGQTTAQAVSATLNNAELADDLGYRRYWFAEHHNMPAVASTSPPVLASAAAARTSRIRVGSGGVMLPNHAPLVVAEQFSALAGVAPGRVDLGLGRAPGSDGIVSQLLRQSGTASGAEQFPQHIAEISALIHPDGAAVQLGQGRSHPVRSTPVATDDDVPEMWLLGSSGYSAQLAAELGLPYVFANHFGGPGLEEALESYRGGFQPSDHLSEPYVLLTVNASVAPTVEEATDRALPQRRTMARLKFNLPMVAQETVEESKANPLPGQAAAAFDGDGEPEPGWAQTIVGTPDTAADGIAALAERHGVDEIMVAPIGGAYDNEPLDRTPGAEQTIRLLGERFRDR
ncbi:MAG: LLM class flavin-dependent oxidoreductase [Mycobacteriaceae bacterium]